MKEFLLNLFLPNFTRVDFSNLIVYLALFFVFQPLIFFNVFLFDFRIAITLIAFLVGSFFFVFKGEKIFGDNSLLYVFACFVLIFSTIEQFKAGFFSFSAKNLFETITAVFSVFTLVQVIVMFLLLWASKLVNLQINERVNERIFAKKTILVSGILTAFLFLILNGLALIPNAATGMVFVFSVDKAAQIIEPNFPPN